MNVKNLVKGIIIGAVAVASIIVADKIATKAANKEAEERVNELNQARDSEKIDYDLVEEMKEKIVTDNKRRIMVNISTQAMIAFGVAASLYFAAKNSMNVSASEGFIKGVGFGERLSLIYKNGVYNSEDAKNVLRIMGHDSGYSNTFVDSIFKEILLDDKEIVNAIKDSLQ